MAPAKAGDACVRMDGKERNVINEVVMFDALNTDNVTMGVVFASKVMEDEDN